LQPGDAADAAGLSADVDRALTVSVYGSRGRAGDLLVLARFALVDPLSLLSLDGALARGIESRVDPLPAIDHGQFRGVDRELNGSADDRQEEQEAVELWNCNRDRFGTFGGRLHRRILRGIGFRNGWHAA
jgi:hypothetical protein